VGLRIIGVNPNRRTRRKMVALCAATEDVGESNDFSLGSITFVGL